MPTNKARTSDNAQKQSASNAIPIFYSDLLFCSLSNKSSSSWSRPCTHHVSSSLPRDQYGINTGLIRERYENDTRTIFSDSHPKLLIRNLIFLSLFLLIIFYISTTCLFQPFMPRRRAHHLPWRSLYTKITFRSAECKPISMN